MTWAMTVGAVVTAGSQVYKHNNQPSAPKPIMNGIPAGPASTSGPMGGSYIDPATGQFVATSDQFDPQAFGQQVYWNNMLTNMLGQGSTQGLNDIQAKKKQLQLQYQDFKDQLEGKSAVGKQLTFSEANGPGFKMWEDKDGKPMAGNREAFNANEALKAEFMRQTAGTHNTYGKGGDDFFRWASDAYSRDVKPFADKFVTETKQSGGNQAVMQRHLNDIQGQMDALDQQYEAIKAQDPNANPFMDFLNKDKPLSREEYEAKFKNPMTDKWGQKASDLLDASNKAPDVSALTDIQGEIPDAKAANAQMRSDFEAKLANVNGGKGDRISQLGDYSSKGTGDFINSLVQSGNISAANALSSGNNAAAARGFGMGGSMGLGQMLAKQQAAQNAIAAKAQGYGLDKAGEASWMDRKFAIDKANQDTSTRDADRGLQIAMTGNSLGQQGFANEMNAQQTKYAQQLQTMGFTSDQIQKMLMNAKLATDENTGLINNSQALVNNAQAHDQQIFADRMDLTKMIQGQTNAGKNLQLQGIDSNQANTKIGLGQGNITQGLQAGAENNNNGLQMAANNFKFQQDVNDVNGAANAISGVGQMAGEAFANYMKDQKDKQDKKDKEAKEAKEAKNATTGMPTYSAGQGSLFGNGQSPGVGPGYTGGTLNTGGSLFGAQPTPNYGWPR